VVKEFGARPWKPFNGLRDPERSYWKRRETRGLRKIGIPSLLFIYLFICKEVWLYFIWQTLTLRGHGEQLIWLNKVKDKRDGTPQDLLFIWTLCNTLELDRALWLSHYLFVGNEKKPGSAGFMTQKEAMKAGSD
jgi:hypothetical protein